MKVHSFVTDPSNVTHPLVFDFELMFFDENVYTSVLNFMNTWWWLSIPYALFYCIMIFIGQEWMRKHDKKYELRTPLILWNAFLAIFSFWGACRCAPELIYSVIQHGFQYSFCDTVFQQGVTGLWSWLFIISKAPETIDTLFIVLRRQKLIFLHWFHHATVLVYAFYSYGMSTPSGRWFGSMNFVIHAIMYGYYALRAARFRIPKSIQQSITILQLLQMVIGTIINIILYKYKIDGVDCMASYNNIRFSLLLYLSYFILFAHFFYKSYMQKGTKKGAREHAD